MRRLPLPRTAFAGGARTLVGLLALACLAAPDLRAQGRGRGASTPRADSLRQAQRLDTDGRHVFVSDETLLGGGYGVHVFSVNSTVGNLLPIGSAVNTGGFLPQFMALWAPPVCTGDVNGDHAVAFSDITDILSNFGGFGTGDADFDGDVDFADVTAVLENFGNTCGQ